MECERGSERWKERRLRICRKQAVHTYATSGCYDALEDASRPFAKLVKTATRSVSQSEFADSLPVKLVLRYDDVEDDHHSSPGRRLF